MTSETYRFTFNSVPEMNDVRDTLSLSLMSAESLHGGARVRLDVRHSFNAANRTVTIDGGTLAAEDVAQLFLDFARREFGEDSFVVERFERSDQRGVPVGAGAAA